MKKSAKQEFMESLEWSAVMEHQIQWFDLDGYRYIGLGDSKGDTYVGMAKISLDYGNHVDHYAQINVRIISMLHGPIDFKAFHFRDYLMDVGRVDQRADFGLPANGFHVSGDFKWYIAVPKTTKPLCAAIERYIDLWA